MEQQNSGRIIFPFPLDVVDAELMSMARGAYQPGVSLTRVEFISDRYIVYKIFDASGWTKSGECGEIELKVFTNGQTLVCEKAKTISDDDLSYHLGWGVIVSKDDWIANERLGTGKTQAEILLGVIQGLEEVRTKLLENICRELQYRLGVNTEKGVGNPGIGDDERVKRFAMIKRAVEIRNKSIRNGAKLTWGQVYSEIGWKDEIDRDFGVFKREIKRFEGIQKNGNQEFLDAIDAMYDEFVESKWED